MPRQTEGWKNGVTLFYRTLLATTEGPTRTTAADWHLKVKGTEYCPSDQNLLHHSQNAQNQLNS